MKKALVYDIISTTEAPLGTVAASLPTAIDSKVWALGYDAPVIRDSGGLFRIQGQIRFNDDAGRTEIAEAITQVVIEGLGEFEIGSVIKLHECPHDEPGFVWPDGSLGCKETICYILDDSTAAQTGKLNSPLKVRIEKDTGKIKHWDAQTGSETEIDNIPAPSTAAQIKARIVEKGLRLR